MDVDARVLLKRIASTLAPETTTAVLSARARAHSHRLVRRWGCVDVNAKLAARFGSVVQGGPFIGTRLAPMAHAEHLGPFLLGTYESELDPAWEEVLRGDFHQIVDVGAKFGYYAVGLARHFPNAEVVAFDTDRWARAATREMARANGTGNVVLRGFCSPRWMRTSLRPGALVVSDCEGYEGALFTSAPIPHLGTATLIIETHDAFNPGVTDRIRERLAQSHEIRTFGHDAQVRAPSVDLGFLTEPERSLATTEIRGPQTWLFCVPKAESKSPGGSPRP